MWTEGERIRSVSIAEPLVASWDAKAAPTQVRLRAYLDELEASLGELPVRNDLYLSMDVDISELVGRRVGDVENYLSPVALRLGWEKFVLVRGRFVEGTGSRVELGTAQWSDGSPTGSGWFHASYLASNMSGWKRSLRSALSQTVDPAPEGDIEVHAIWHCSEQRNWVEPLWKETIDAMGPVLGATNPDRPFDVNDDRIRILGLHRHIDSSIGWGVKVELWWRPADGGIDRVRLDL
jgi:hypothetical protein